MSWWRLVAVFFAFLLPVSANVFAAASWELLVGSPPLSAGGSAATLSISAAAFVLALGWLVRERHRILDHRMLFSPEPVEPRPVLITGLSDLRSPELDAARGLLERVRRGVLGLNDLALPPDEVAEKFGSEVAGLRWIQNLRAIRYHQSRIERVIVVPSAQSQAQFHLFRDLIAALAANTPEMNRRELTIAAVGRGVDFAKYNPIQQAMAEALREARKPRSSSQGGRPRRALPYWRRAQRPRAYREADISIDVTPGTKQFSIVAAVSSFGPEGRFLYVDNSGEPQSCNVALCLAGGLLGD